MNRLDEVYGLYFAVARLFVKAIGNPRVMNYLTQHGLHHPGLMGFALKLMANITDTRGGDVGDRLINGLSRLAPTA